MPGHCLHETFFVGEEWNSHFDAILGQSFLQSHTCDLSWEGGDYIDMRLFPDGNRKGDAITVRLLKRKNFHTPIQVGVAEVFESDGSGAEEEEDPGPSNIQQTIPYPHPPHIEPEYYASDESDQPFRRSSLSGSEDEGYRGQSDMEVEEEEVEDWYDVDQPSVPNTHVSQIAPRGDLSELYHRALMDFKMVPRPESQPSSHADAQEAYNAHTYKAFHHIPIGDWILNMDEGG